MLQPVSLNCYCGRQRLSFLGTYLFNVFSYWNRCTIYKGGFFAPLMTIILCSDHGRVSLGSTVRVIWGVYFIDTVLNNSDENCFKSNKLEVVELLRLSIWGVHQYILTNTISKFWLILSSILFFRKRLMELQPRRQSSRLEKLKHQKEVEKQAEEQKLQSELTKKDDKDQKEKERRDRYDIFLHC